MSRAGGFQSQFWAMKTRSPTVAGGAAPIAVLLGGGPSRPRVEAEHHFGADVEGEHVLGVDACTFRDAFDLGEELHVGVVEPLGVGTSPVATSVHPTRCNGGRPRCSSIEPCTLSRAPSHTHARAREAPRRSDHRPSHGARLAGRRVRVRRRG